MPTCTVNFSGIELAAMQAMGSQLRFRPEQGQTEHSPAKS